jgi:hypothetical protein
MGGEPGTEAAVLSVPHAELSTRLFNEFGDGRVIDVANPREKVVFNLKVQATQKPALDLASTSKVHCSFHLMYRPGVFNRSRTFPR